MANRHSQEAGASPKTDWWERLDSGLDRITRTARRWRWVGYLITAAIFLLLLWVLWRDWQSLGHVDLRAMWSAIIGCFLIYPLSYVPQILAWTQLVGRRHSFWKDVEIYVYTHLMRRLPGGVWHWAGRVVLYHEASGASSQTTLRASLQEWVLLLVAAANSYGLAMLAGSSVTTGLLLIATSLIAAGLLVARTHGFLQGIAFLLGYSMAWWIGGLMIYWLAYSNPGSQLPLHSAVAVWTVAGGISTATFFMPAGLGVRELSLAFLLRPFMPVSSAVVIAILMRLVFVIGDLTWGTPAWAAARRLSSLHSRNTEETGSQ